MENKILTFDCYGTLLDMSDVTRTIKHIAITHHQEPEVCANLYTTWEDRLMYGEEYRDFEDLIKEILIYMDRELSIKVFVPAYDQVIRAYENLKPFPDVLPTLEICKKEGWRIILMSNTSRRLMSLHMEALNHLPDGALTAEDMHCYKPQLEFFEKIQELLLHGNCRHIHIAKGYWWDIVPAEKMGWNRIWVNRDGYRSLPGHPVENIHSLKELPFMLFHH